MRKTVQIRISTESHAILKEISLGGVTISKLGDEAVLLLKEERDKNNLEYQAMLDVLYPNREKINDEMTPKTPRYIELSTTLKNLQKDMRPPHHWTSPKDLADNGTRRKKHEDNK